MATITVSASTTLAALTYAADDDIVITGAATLTVDADPTAYAAIRSIRSASPRATFKVRNPNTAFTAGNLWRLSFTNPGSAIGSGQATLGFTAGASMDFEGEWLECYTATGAASETVLDASNVLGVDIDFPYFIEAETAPGSGVWKAVPVGVVGTSGNGYLTTVAQSAFGTGDVGRVLFYDHATRLLKTGDGTNGSLFASGTKFRIPNIYIHMPAFTLTVAAGGWTTGTGTQNVVSTTNAPILGAGNVNYTAGVECFNVSALPSGTTVTVNNRASEGTVATAHAAGVVLYALPDSSSQLAGRISISSNGNFKSRCCLFSRWMFPFTNTGASWSQTDSGLCTTSNYGTPYFNGVLGACTVLRGVVYPNHGRGLHSMLRLTGQVGSISIDGPLLVSPCSAASTTSHNNQGNPLTFAAGTVNVAKLDNLRIWKIGFGAGMTSQGPGLLYQTATPLTGEIKNHESVGCTVNVAASNIKVTGWRYSQTNGFLTTATPQAVFSVGATSGAATVNATIQDFDLLGGGVAPYVPWFSFATFVSKCLVHNKIAGVPRSIDCQGRTQIVFINTDGSDNILAAAYFTNMRGSGQAQINGNVGLRTTVRNVRVAHTNGVIINQSGNIYDFPSGPWSANGINQYSDSGTFYAAPNSYPSLAGGLYLGPVSRQEALDQFELTAGAYTNNSGDFFLETAGDAVWFKSTARITGIASITGGAVVYNFQSNITSGVTAEFRLCKWGDDISAVSWGTFTGPNVQTAFNALSGYTPYIGLNFQLRFTATTTIAGRYLRQVVVPCQMDTAYNPAVGQVDVTAIGAENGGLMAVYDGSSILQGTTTIASGTGSVAAPYDFDGTDFTYTLKIRALEAESIDITSTYQDEGALVPTPMATLTGYTTGPDTGVTFNKGTKTVTVTASMTTQDLWSRWRRYIVQLVNFDTDDSWSYPALDLGDWNIIVNAADLTGNLTTTGTASQASGGRFVGVVQASNGSSGLLTVNGLTAAQVYLQNDSGVQQDYQPSQTGPYTYATPFGATGTWRLVVNAEGYFPQTFDFDPGQSNEFAVTLQLLRNPDGTLLYQGGSYPEIACTFVTAGNMRVRFGVEVTLQKIVDATQQAYSTSAGMAWLAAGNAELTAAILSAGQFIFLPERTRLFGTALNAALASFAVSADAEVVDPDTDFPIRYVQPPSVAGSAEEIAAAIRADQVTELLRIIELAKLHGLDDAAPLVVSPTARTAGSIEQSIGTVGDVVTVTRTA